MRGCRASETGSAFCSGGRKRCLTSVSVTSSARTSLEKRLSNPLGERLYLPISSSLDKPARISATTAFADRVFFSAMSGYPFSMISDSAKASAFECSASGKGGTDTAGIQSYDSRIPSRSGSISYHPTRDHTSCQLPWRSAEGNLLSSDRTADSFQCRLRCERPQLGGNCTSGFSGSLRQRAVAGSPAAVRKAMNSHMAWGGFFTFFFALGLLATFLVIFFLGFTCGFSTVGGLTISF